MADGVMISRVARLEQLAPEDRLDPERVVTDIAASGKPAFYENTADDIVQRLKPLVHEGDVVIVFSNGGFDGIHQKLLDRL
jgi:UDP-N-acetylmuramate: L-alanyl-gamma-D-glutamyl-meso-diaminopimelate ligase